VIGVDTTNEARNERRSSNVLQCTVWKQVREITSEGGNMKEMKRNNCTVWCVLQGTAY
jgi:hypothetical protein